MRATALPNPTLKPLRSKRLLGMADDERLVEQIRAGNEAAFEVVFERYGKGILSFCRHMLGSQEEAEDAAQHTFSSAYRDLLRDGEREVRLKPWLYTIARNRCLSTLRARREQVQLDRELPTAGLAEQVEQRGELRDLLRDLRDLPAEQRAALLLAEVADMSHADIGQVLDCEAARVKALVFRARSSLIERRDARDTPCDEIREQLSVLSGGSLRRSSLKHHLRHCEGCRDFREQVKRQRQLLAVALPVLPPAWLKAHVLGAAGGGGGAASAGGAGLGAAAAGAGGAGAAAPIGTAVLAKVGVLAVLAGTGGVATEAALDSGRPAKGPDGAGEQSGSAKGSQPGSSDPAARGGGKDAGGSPAAADGRQASDRDGGRAHGNGPADNPGRGPAEVPGSRGQGVEHRAPQAGGVPHGNGPPTAPPAGTPVRRRPERPAKPTRPTRPPQAQERPAPPDHPTPPANAGGPASDDG